MKSGISTLLILVILFSGFVLSTATETESNNVVILSSSIYQTYGFSPFDSNQGDYHVVGEVQNFGAQAMHFNITCRFYDSMKNTIGIAYLSDSSPDFGPSYLHLLLPGKTSPFALFLSRFNQVGNFILVDHYELTLTASPATLFELGLEITEHNSQQNAGTFMISGEIKNIGTDYIDGFNVFATFYDAQGDVLAVSSEGGGYGITDSYGQSGFPPKNTSSFQVTLNDFPHGGRLERISHYELAAEGYDYSIWNADGQLISPEVVYFLGSLPSSTPQPTPTQTTQPSITQDYPITIYLTIIIIAVIIVFLTIILFKHKSKVTKLS